MQTQNSTSMDATRRTAPRLQAAPGAHGLTKQAHFDHVWGQPEAAWIGNLGKAGTVTGKIA